MHVFPAKNFKMLIFLFLMVVAGLSSDVVQFQSVRSGLVLQNGAGGQFCQGAGIQWLVTRVEGVTEAVYWLENAGSGCLLTLRQAALSCQGDTRSFGEQWWRLLPKENGYLLLEGFRSGKFLADCGGHLCVAGNTTTTNPHWFSRKVTPERDEGVRLVTPC
jgi:hypothetical protein